MKFRPYINQIRTQLDKLNPDQKLRERLTGAVEPDREILFNLASADERGPSIKLMEAVIWFLYRGDMETVSTICARQGVTGIERAELATIAFDLAVESGNVDTQYLLASSFFFDESRISTGILNYIETLMEKNNLTETTSVMKKFRSKMIPEQRQQAGRRVFQKALSYSADTKQVNYAGAYEIYKIFDLDRNFVDPIILQHYDVEINRKNYVTAAELALSFNLDSHRLKEAAYRALEEAFAEFRGKYDLGLYAFNAKLSPGDPFCAVEKLVRTYGLVDEFHLLDPAGKHYYQKSQDLGFFFLKKICQSLPGGPEELWVAIFFSAKLISVFRLDNVSNLKLAQDVDDIIGKIAFHLDETLQDSRLANSYYHALISYFSFLSSHKQVIRRLGERLFNFLIADDRVKEAADLYSAFKFQDAEIKDALFNRILVLLKLNKMEVFREYLDTFKLVPLIKNNESLLSRIYAQLDENIRHLDFKQAQSLVEIFEIPIRGILQPLRSMLQTLMLNKRDDDALKLMREFDVRISHVIPILQEAYCSRAAGDWKQGKEFRGIYRLNAYDVGVFNWFFLEILRIDRLRQWYMGKEINPSNPPRGKKE